MTAPSTATATRTRRRRSAGTLGSLRRRLPGSGTVTGALSAAVAAVLVAAVAVFDGAYWAHALRSSASAVVLVLLVGEFVMLAAAGAGAALPGGGS